MSEGKASPGSPFKPPAARIWNNMVDAGRAWADSRLNGGPPNPIRPRETDIIKAKNTSGAARRLGEILRISGKAIETVTDENKWLLGVEPTDDGYFGILKEPVENNGLASLQVSGCCMALVNVTDADHKRARSEEGEYVLQSGDDGPIEILFAPDGTGEKTCVIRFSSVGGGGAPKIRFTILSTSFTVGLGALGCDHVVVRVDHVSCSGTGVAVGDEVNVYDPEYCHFNLPIELLIGLSGTATRYKSENYQPDLEYLLDCVAEVQTAGCMWMIDTLCCSEEEIISE